MKNCPYCKAQLADEADFCLYCMKPLSEKEIIPPANRRPKGWLFALGGLLFILLAVAAVLWLWPWAGEDPNEPAMNVTTLPSSSATTAPTTAATVSTSSVTTLPTTTPSTATRPTTLPTDVTTKPTAKKPTTSSTTARPTTAPTTLPPASNAVQYLYRSARAGDDFYASYQNPGDHIVITGVNNLSADGVYHIPETIDDQTVVAIVSNAFYNSGATEVYIPASIKTVHRFAFFGCPLSDVYFMGKSIYCYDDAFPSGFVLHCAPDCNDRNLRYYLKYASEMGAVWSEWHNTPLMTAADEYGVVYNYRLSIASDHPGDPAYQNPGNHITITSIHTPSADQNYHIPKTLDGLTVAFIGPMAFCQKFANSLYIPESVIAISSGAFYSGGVADVYFCHDLYIPPNSLVMPAEPTLHCPKEARSGPDGKVFSENPSYWNALYWAEWNGEV